MSSRIEFNKKLDDIPTDAPYEIIANLREQHRLLHRAVVIDESGPISPTSIEELVSQIAKSGPGPLQQALNLEEESLDVCEQNIFHKWARPALKILTCLRANHIPPSAIEHKF